MCEFHDCNCNGLGDIWWTDKCMYFSSIDVGQRYSKFGQRNNVLVFLEMTYRKLCYSNGSYTFFYFLHLKQNVEFGHSTNPKPCNVNTYPCLHNSSIIQKGKYKTSGRKFRPIIFYTKN